MITIHEAVADFLLAKKAGRRAATTLRWYATVIKPFDAAFGEKLLTDMTMRNVATWLTEQVGAEHTAVNRDRVLRVFFGWSARHYHAGNPMKSIPVPRLPEPEPKAIDADDINRLIEVCETTRDAALLLVLADCGLRASGIISVDIDEVDFAARVIRVCEKGGRWRAVPFSLETERALIAWCKDRPKAADKLFCAYTGDPLSYWGLREIIRRLAFRAGFIDERCNLHSFRHFAAREYLRQGGSLPALARILGQRDINTTSRYYAIYAGSELAEVHDAHSPLNSLKKPDVI